MITRLRQAVDASGEVIFMTDRKGLFTFVNRQFEQLYGYTASEVVGLKTPSVLKSGEVQPDEYAALWQALTEGRTAQLAVVNRCKDGRLVNIEATASPVWDDGKTIVGFLAIQRDVTERALAEKERRFQQAVLSTERELTLDGILVVDDNAKVICTTGASNRCGASRRRPSARAPTRSCCKRSASGYATAIRS